MTKFNVMRPPRKKYEFFVQKNNFLIYLCGSNLRCRQALCRLSLGAIMLPPRSKRLQASKQLSIKLSTRQFERLNIVTLIYY